MGQRERWMPVVGYEGLYEVSDLGGVRSLPRLDRKGRRVKGGLMRTPRHQFGYPMVMLKVDGKAKTRTVHSMILEAFVGPRPEGHHARHLDGNPENSTLSNLAWGTRSENQQDMARHGRAGRYQAAKTECPQGHEYTEENTYRYRRKKRNGEGFNEERACKTCRDHHWGKGPSERT